MDSKAKEDKIRRLLGDFLDMMEESKTESKMLDQASMMSAAFKKTVDAFLALMATDQG